LTFLGQEHVFIKKASPGIKNPCALGSLRLSALMFVQRTRSIRRACAEGVKISAYHVVKVEKGEGLEGNISLVLNVEEVNVAE
jgi:hypothetical protein